MTCNLSASVLLSDLLAARAEPAARAWLDAQCQRLAAGELSAARAHMAFSAVPRRFGRVTLQLAPAEQERIAATVPGLVMHRWTLDELARARLLLATPEEGSQALVERVDALCADADLHELMAVYRSLPLLPHPEALRARAAEGIRSNMTAVVEAVACDSPYPAAHLDDGAFAQLVLKCLFIGVPLWRVVGLDTRITGDLAVRLIDYVRERRAANRTIPLELWRCVGPVVTGDALDEVVLTLREGDPRERLAAALSLRANPAAGTALSEHPDLLARLNALPGDDPWRALVEG